MPDMASSKRWIGPVEPGLFNPSAQRPLDSPPFSHPRLVSFLQMQSSVDAEPIVRIRELKKNSVNFVLQNVDLSFVSQPHLPLSVALIDSFG